MAQNGQHQHPTGVNFAGHQHAQKGNSKTLLVQMGQTYGPYSHPQYATAEDINPL